MNNCLKITFFIITSLIFSACSRDNEAANILTSIKYAVYGKKSSEITRDKINSIPYASISAQIGKGQKSFLVLGLIDNQNLGWYSADRNVFITNNGRLVKTEGLPKNLSNTKFIDEDPISKHRYG